MAMIRGKRTTLKDIAREVGMSCAAISRILRGDPLFNQDTIKRVQEKARELDYRPNILARALVNRGSSLIGLVLRDLVHSFYVDIIAGVQEEVESKGFSILLGNSTLDPVDERRHLRILIDKVVEGIIITPISTEQTNRAAFTEIVEQGIPLVMVGNPKNGVNAPFVKVDNTRGGEVAARHLLDLGHRRFAYITYDRGEFDCRKKTLQSENIERHEGFSRTLRKAGHADTLSVVEAPGLKVTDATIDALLAINPRPTGLFFYSDHTAIQAIRLLEKRGLRVPRDFSVVGFDDIEMAAMASPALTTIAQPKKDMGRFAAIKLLDMLKGEAVTETVLQPALIVRETSGPPRA